MAARRSFHTLPGRPPLVRFPIERAEVCQGHELRREIHLGAETRCVRCGQRFQMNETTAIRRNDALDDMVYIRCPWCGYLAAVTHYFERIEGGTRPRRMQTPEDIGPAAAILTPERREG